MEDEYMLNYYILFLYLLLSFKSYKVEKKIKLNKNYTKLVNDLW